MVLPTINTYGNKKAAVFPEPVWAHPIRSRPLMIHGMAVFWIGVGFLYPDFSILSTRICLNPILSNEETGAGAFSPLHFTFNERMHLVKEKHWKLSHTYRNVFELAEINPHINSRFEQLFVFDFLKEKEIFRIRRKNDWPCDLPWVHKSRLLFHLPWSLNGSLLHFHNLWPCDLPRHIGDTCRVFHNL